MMQLTPQMRILVAVEPADFRKGIDGLCGLCRQTLASDPLICGGRQYVASASAAGQTKWNLPITRHVFL